MKVLVSCNTMHGVPLAVALEESGYDVKFATSIAFPRRPRLLNGRIGEPLRRRVDARVFPELRDVEILRYFSPEILFRLSNALRAGSPSFRSRMANTLFDRYVRRHVRHTDVLHFVNGLGLYCAREARRRGKPVILEHRAAHLDHNMEVLEAEYRRYGLSYSHPESAFTARIREELALADAVLVPSSYAKQTFRERGIADDRLHVLPFGHNLDAFRPSSSGGDDRFTVLFVGRIEPAKGVMYLLEAVRQLALPDVELRLVGGMDSVTRKILRGEDGEFVHTPHVPRQALPEIYQKASVFVLPSLTDAWGFVVLEAMASGLPVIVTASTGAKDVVREGIDGFVVPASDANALADRIKFLHDNPLLRMRMGKAAARRAHQQFSSSAYAVRIAEVYPELLAGLTR